MQYQISRISILILLAGGLCRMAPAGNLQAGTAVIKNVQPWTKIGSNLKEGFWGWNSLYHLAGAGGTFLLVNTDADYRVNKYFYENDDNKWYSGMVTYVGYIMPFVLGGGMYGIGRWGNHPKLYIASCAYLQAAFTSYMYHNGLKAVTGRIHPDRKNEDDMKKASREFNFGFWRNGIHWGWPSGHSIVNTASMTALMYVYKDNWWILGAGGAYIVWMLSGVIMHDASSMHWFSDMAAGGLMGYAIGSAVGGNFRAMFDRSITGNAGGKVNISLHPHIKPGASGMLAQLKF